MSHSQAKTRPAVTLLDPAVWTPAFGQAARKLRPAALIGNPVIFVTAVGAVLTTLSALHALFNGAAWGFSAHIALWLWFTVYFANLAEAVAEGRGKARADALRGLRSSASAKKLVDVAARRWREAPATELTVGDLILIEAGDVVPADGDAIEGVASVDESAITGESAPVIRESGGDRSAVTGGSRLLSDWLVVRVTQPPGAGFIDRMIALVEGAKRRKTPNEIALSILLAGMTLIFLITVVTLWPLAAWSGAMLTVPVLTALLVTLIPTTIGGLMSAIGVAGMDRLARFNMLAASGRAVEAAGDVDALLLDKTGTITFGNRMAAEFIPAPGVSERAVAEAALTASLSDDTPEGRSIVALAQERFSFGDLAAPEAGSRQVAFSAHTRLSGVDLPDRALRKGAVDSVLGWLAQSRPNGAAASPDAIEAAARIARAGGTPLAVAETGRLLGIIHLKDVIKPGVKERFSQLRAMGVRTVMVTGDNKLTAAAIAAEAGVDDFVAEATPEDKLRYIRAEQAQGRMVAMCGDGTNDAPALAQADVGVAMQTGTQAAREAGNMIDLDSDPTKLIEVVHIGKQLLMTRGALTTFSIANDVAKYFAIIPALFLATLPDLRLLNVMDLTSPNSAILAAVIFNALIIVALIPLALKGVSYQPVGAAQLLRRNLLIYGGGGLIAPFIGIKAIDLLLTAVGLA